MSLTNLEADFSEIILVDGGNVRLTYQDNTVVLDLPDIKDISEGRRIEIIDGLNRLLQKDEYTPLERLSFSDKIGFILDRSRGDIVLTSSVEVVTRTGMVVVSKSSYQVDGDIISILTDAMPVKNRDFLYQAHLLAIKLYMKHWRNNVLGLVEKIRIVLGWINRIQAFASVISLTIFLTGLLTGRSSYMLVSLLPILTAGILSVVKSRL